MSQLRLALPECKFKNDSDDLLKDQFIFGIYDVQGDSGPPPWRNFRN